MIKLVPWWHYKHLPKVCLSVAWLAHLVWINSVSSSLLIGMLLNSFLLAGESLDSTGF